MESSCNRIKRKLLLQKKKKKEVGNYCFSNGSNDHKSIIYVMYIFGFEENMKYTLFKNY